jgi:NAD(P)-dependent dehydrogenase (short-subunit alcohol dehydrogenase family)
MTTNTNELSGRVALVTGASSGIGREVAIKLSSLGARLVLTGRREEALAIPGDVRDEKHAEEAIQKTVDAFSALHILVNNAGVIGSGPVESTTTLEWNRILDIDLKGPFLFCRAAIPALKKAGPGASIVNISSVTGLRPYANVAPYCVAKAGVDMLTQCLALELAPFGIRVNAVNPGVVTTNLHKASNAVPDYDAFLERSKSTHPLGFVGEPKDAAELVAFLVSDRARWITGGLHPLDGGRQLASAR